MKGVPNFCEICAYWVNTHHLSRVHPGECRRFPPVVMQDDTDEDYAAYQMTEAMEWCGEHSEGQPIGTKPVAKNIKEWMKG